MKLLLILNPKAGIRRANRFLTDILAMFCQNGYDCTVYATGARGDGTRYAREHAQDADLVICIGGDGTLNEVITGLQQAGTQPEVGYIPAGSTNDFAASIKLSNNILKAAKSILNGTAHTYDIGTFKDRYFTYVASFGALTEASYSTPQESKNALGQLAYILEGIKDLPAIKPIHMCFEANGETYEDDYLFGAISNSLRIAGIIKLNKSRVDMNDGLFEVMLIKVPKNAGELAEVIHALNVGQYNVPEMTFFSAPEILVRTNGKTPWTIDGEYAEGSSEILIRNLHDGLKLRK